MDYPKPQSFMASIATALDAVTTHPFCCHPSFRISASSTASDDSYYESDEYHEYHHMHINTHSSNQPKKKNTIAYPPTRLRSVSSCLTFKTCNTTKQRQRQNKDTTPIIVGPPTIERKNKPWFFLEDFSSAETETSTAAALRTVSSSSRPYWHPTRRRELESRSLLAPIYHTQIGKQQTSKERGEQHFWKQKLFQESRTDASGARE